MTDAHTLLGGLLGLMVVLGGVSCKSESSDGPTVKTSAAAVETASAAPAKAVPAPAQAEGEGFSVQLLAPEGGYKAGSEGELVVLLEAKSPYKCNAEYPHKFKFTASDGVKAPEVVSKEALKLEDKQATLTAKITPEKPGKQRVEGTLSFSVCTPERCMIERKKLGLDIVVN